jgi:hypothetical protein
MSNSLPHAQKLYERFRKDKRVRIVAVATAFEKKQYPWMADEEKIRQALREKNWQFPVMRDKEEKTVRILGLAGTYGTPTTLVVDSFGVVRWHGFNPSGKTAAEVEATVERLLKSFHVPAIEDLHPRLKAYGEEKFGEARERAIRILSEEDADPELRAQAKQVLESLEKGVERLVRESGARREAGYPNAARAKLEKAVALFKGVPEADEAAKSLKALQASPAYKRELRAEKALEKELSRAKPSQKKLKGLLRTFDGTPVTKRIEAALKR